MPRVHYSKAESNIVNIPYRLLLESNRNVFKTNVQSFSQVRRRRLFNWMVPIGVVCLLLFAISRNYDKHKRSSVQSISAEFEEILHQQRLEIETEMEGYPYDDLSARNVRELSDLVMENGGKPLRNVIVSTWRSGSSFLGDLVNAHPASYYYFEPLLHFGIVQFRQPLPTREPLDTLNSLFNCEFSNLDAFLKYRSTDKWHSDDYNRYLKKQCHENENTCHDPVFSTKFCRLFPFQVTKIVGLGLALMDTFLEDNDLGIKIVFLVRDPRGTLHSRKSLDWCKNAPNCLDSASLCANMLLDYATAMDFSKRFPKKFKVLRYEDLASHPQRISREVYSFYGMAFHNDVSRFVNTHTKVSHGNEYSTFRNSAAVSFQWKEKMTFNEVNAIQENCFEALRIWGYNLAFNDSHQRTFNPLQLLTTENINYFR